VCDLFSGPGGCQDIFLDFNISLRMRNCLLRFIYFDCLCAQLKKPGLDPVGWLDTLHVVGGDKNRGVSGPKKGLARALTYIYYVRGGLTAV
jgi:hypothetical protein